MNAHRGIYPYECVPCQKVSTIGTLTINFQLHIQKYPSQALLGQHYLRSAAHRDDRLKKKLMTADTQYQAEMLELEETHIEETHIEEASVVEQPVDETIEIAN